MRLILPPLSSAFLTRLRRSILAECDLACFQRVPRRKLITRGHFDARRRGIVLLSGYQLMERDAGSWQKL